jgi:Zn-dependent protease
MSTRTFYRIDSTRVSLREYWWGSHSPAILIAALLKLLRVRIPSATDDPNVESLCAFEIEPSAVPEEVRTRFATQLRHLEHLGFSSPVWHAIDDDLHHVQTYLATMAHRAGHTWARVHNRLWHFHTPPRNVLFTELVTEHKDGTFVWSLSSKPDLAAPPSCTVVRRRDATPTTLWTAHRAALPRKATVPVGSPEDLRASIERHHAAVRDFHLRRGVFRPTSEAERRAAETHEADRQAASAGGSRYPEIVAEVQRLQRGQSSLTSAILILLVSVALFVGMGGRSLAGGDGTSWQTLVALLPILFFHEAGHWLAMRLFGYRNVKMFFIPFFGAAVSGRHYNVPGWKKAAVSLMGPLPGIVVGIVLGVIGLLIQQPLLLKAALMTLLLNGFNLLPVLPLDGGWVLEAILFSRHMVLELLFRVLAILGLVGLGLGSGDRILGMLGLVMLLSLPTSYKLARITRDLRRSELQPVSADDQTIPAATAEAIIARIKEAFPAKLPTKQAAQHTLQVFETLNARPPGVLASLGIGLVHGTSLVVAVVCASIFLVGQQTNLRGLLRSAATLPKRALDPASIEIHRASDSQQAPPGPHETVVASFATAAEARKAFVAAQRGPSHTALRLFGQSLLVALAPGDDAAREQWLGLLKGLASDVFVATPETSAQVQLSCLAPSADEASRIEQELGDYFLGASMHIVPPWLEGDRTPAERTRHARARRTFAQLARAPAVAYQDPRLRDQLKKEAAAHRRRDAKEIERLRSERNRLAAELWEKEIARIRQAPETDAEVVARHQVLFAGGARPPDPQRMTAELGPLLGQLELVGGAPKPGTATLAATGAVSREGLLLTMPFVRFEDPFEGPPALVKWLRDRGCVDFRYDLTPGFVPGQDGEQDEL